MDIEAKFEYTIHRADVSKHIPISPASSRFVKKKLTVSFHPLPSRVQQYHRGLGPQAHGSSCPEAH